MRIINFIKKVANALKQEKIHPIFQYVDKENVLNNKVALVTGGSGEIGFAIAEALIRSGCTVIITGTNEDKLKNNCNRTSKGMSYIKLDLSHVHTIADAVNQLINSIPEHKIDILVNSAGFHGEWDFDNITETDFDKVMDVNVKGTYFITNYIARHMIKNKIKGHILNISSSSSLRPAWTPYQISKWAVNGMTKGFADYLLPYGIIVNAIAPGPTATAMVKSDGDENIYYQHQPSHRYLTVQEIANLAVFMVSNMGDMIVGDTVYMTGGSGVLSYHM